MTQEIGRGDFVECVDDAPSKKGQPMWIQAGSVYQVDQCDLKTLSGAPAVSIAGNPINDLREVPQALDLRRFRPIYRPKQSLIESLRTVSRDQVLA